MRDYDFPRLWEVNVHAHYNPCSVYQAVFFARPSCCVCKKIRLWGQGKDYSESTVHSIDIDSYYEEIPKDGKNSLIIDLLFRSNFAIFAMCSKHHINRLLLWAEQCTNNFVVPCMFVKVVASSILEKLFCSFKCQALECSTHPWFLFRC